jgi:hypothetical protein
MQTVARHRAHPWAKLLLTSLILVVFLFGFANVGPAPTQAAGDNRPSRLTLAEIAAMARAAGDAPIEAPVNEGAMIPKTVQDRLDRLNEASIQALGALQAAGSVDATPRGDAPQTIGTPFTSGSLTQLRALPPGSSSIPPDTMGAVGPTQFVTHINVYLTVHDKAGASQNLALFGDANGIRTINFFTTVAGGATPFDTRVRFDRHSQRWILTAETFATGNNRLVIAVSDTAVLTPATVFQFFYLNFAGVAPTSPRESDCFYDYPTLGIDEDALYVATNLFASGASYPCATFSGIYGGYGGSSALVIRKADLLNPATPADITTYNPGIGNTATAFRGLLDWGPGTGDTFAGPYMPQGVDNFDTGTNAGYFIGIDGCCFDIFRVTLRRISNPGGVPTMSGDLNVTLPKPFDYPIRIPHLGNDGGGSSGGNIDVGDGRLMSAHIRNGVLYTTSSAAVLPDGTHTGGVGSPDLRTGTNWVMINNLGVTPTLVDQGIIFDPDAIANNPDQYNYPSIMSSGQGHVALGMSAINGTIYAGAATVGRLATDPAGTVQGLPVIYQPGLDAYNLRFSGTRKRWGDYSYTSLDPCDDMSMWTIQEFANTPVVTFSQFTPPQSGNWGTSVVRLGAPAPVITSVDPATAPRGQASVTVTLNGTGFYNMAANGVNPSAGCPANPFGVTVGGGTGATVTNVTWISPTVVSVTLNTTGATAGPATLTLTNSDGQSIGGNLTITNPSTGDTIGVRRPSNGVFYLRTTNTTGAPEYSILYGFPTDIGLTGDWNGDNIDTVGFYRPSTAFFTLSDTPAASVVGLPTTNYNFGFGSLATGDIPVVGDWDGNGRDSVGIYRPGNRTFYLRNALSGGFADATIFMPFAQAGDIPIAGDWNGDLRHSPGMYRPSTSQFLLTNRFFTGNATLHHLFTFGLPGDRPVVGDWNNDNRDGIGVMRGTSVFLRNSIVSGPADFTFTYGSVGDNPLGGRWVAAAAPSPIIIRPVEDAKPFDPGQ